MISALTILGAFLFGVGAREAWVLLRGGIRRKRETGHKTLEQQISELWASRGYEVKQETAEALGEHKFKWTIIAADKQDT